MAIPSSAYFSTWDITPKTDMEAFDRTIWGVMQPKNPVLDLISKGEQISNTVYDWYYRKPEAKYVVSINTMNSSDTTVTISESDFNNAKIEVGTILRDTSPTALVTAGTGGPLGSGFKLGELMQVTDIAGPSSGNYALTVTRDVGGFAGTGGTVPSHAAGAVFEVMWTPKQEGSEPGPNRWQTLGHFLNYTVTVDFFLNISGSQLARAMKDANGRRQIELQYEDRMLDAARKIESALLYGAQNTVAPAGSDSAIRQMNGLFFYLLQPGGNVDFTSTVLTPSVLNNLFKMIYNDGGDPNDPYIIICSPDQAQVISSFGEDKVRVERTDRQYGRYITSYLSDLGFVAQVVPTAQCHRSDLAIVNTRKWRYLPYRPWFKKAPEQLADAEVVRAITEFTCEVVDPLTAHAAVTTLT